MSDEADENAYLLDHHGQVVAAPLAKATSMLGIGYTPAGPEQIADFKKQQAFHEKYGTVGQQIATGAEAAAGAASFGLSPLVERGLGVPAEDIRNRKEENPNIHTAGTVFGVAAPLIASGGTSALGEAAEFTAPSLISKLGEAAEGVTEHLIGEQPTAVGRILAKAASSAASGLTEGTAWGAGQVVNEAAMGDPNLTASHALEEVGLSALLGGGISGTTGIMSGLIGEGASSGLERKLEDWTSTFEGNQNIKTAAGPGKGQSALTKLYKKMSPEQASKLGREAGDMGLISPLDKPATVFEKSGQMMDEVGPKIDEGLQRIDSLPDAVRPNVGKVLDSIRTDVLAPLDVAGADKGFVSKVGEDLQNIERDLGGADAEMTFKQMNDVRRNINKRIYGYNGDLSVSSAYKGALRDIADGFGEHLQKGIADSGEDFAPIAKLNRQYSVAATLNRIAEKGTAAAGLSGVPLTAVMSGLTGLVHGGPLGAAVLGGGAMLAKRYGPQVLAAGARAARSLIDEEAAAGLASKSAEMMASAREAGNEAASATRASALWRGLGKKLEAPVVAPGKDLARDVSQEKLGGEQPEGTPVETVAALSQLEAANKRVNDRVSGLAKAMVAGKTARGAATALSAEEMAKELERVHNLAGNPDTMLQHVTAQNKDIQDHAPNTATALATVSTRAVNHLHMKFPPPPKMSPLSPAPKPNKNDLWKYNRTRDVLLKPSNLLKHAANGTMIPDQVQAVASVHPEMLQQMQQAVLEEMTGAKTVPHTARMMASMLLSQPMDAGMAPQAIASNQAVFNRPSLKNGQDQTQPMGGKSTQGGLAKLNVSGHSMLPGQAVESRRGEA